jgi:deoxyadenosine/deoxycytidine kinase
MSSGRSTPFSGARPALANAFVSISGLIGAGKSTLAVALGKELNLPVHFEPVAENVYLQDFYKDMKTYAGVRNSVKIFVSFILQVLFPHADSPSK